MSQASQYAAIFLSGVWPLSIAAIHFNLFTCQCLGTEPNHAIRERTIGTVESALMFATSDTVQPNNLAATEGFLRNSIKPPGSHNSETITSTGSLIRIRHGTPGQIDLTIP